MKYRITNLKARVLAHPSPQYMVAAAAGIDPSTMTQLVLGRSPLLIHHKRALAKVLECEMEDLVGWQEIESLDQQ